jgi:hypothetical protein
MRDAGRSLTVEDRDQAFAIATRMSSEVAAMAGRLARLIAPSPIQAESPLAQGHAFLSAMFEAHPRGPQLSGAENHPLDRLSSCLSLTRTDVDLIVLAGMAEEHEGYASIMRSLSPRSEPHATAGLAAQLTCEDPRDRFELRRTLEQGAAVRAGVIALGGDAPFFERNLALAEGLWPVLCGLDVYPPGVRVLSIGVAASGLDEWLASTDVAAVVCALAAGDPRAVLIVGDSEACATARAVALAAACGLPWIAFEFGQGMAAHADRLALLHALARGAVPIFTLTGADGPGPAPMPRLDAFPGPVIVCARRGTAEAATRLPVVMLDTPPLTMASRERMWREMLPELAADATTLASRYVIEPSAVTDVVSDLRACSRLNGGAIDLAGVANCVRVRSNLPLGAGVKLVRPTARWDQLVLPPDRKGLLVEALHRLMHQGTVLDRWKFLTGRPGARGVRVLLSGPPGTGKTLSAEVMASSLGVDLMIVDISRVVSKWIGETEKHLAQAFDAAERAQAILLFDEADALFGKRTEVSDAHDRYANLETAYLLSRLERFEGLAILSTNLKQNIDPAFLRRLEFAIDFDEPSAIEREALWRCHLPPEAPLAADVNLQELAALYPMVGGLIRNASVAAGFLAAASGAAIGRHHLIGAIRREYEKSANAFPGVPPGIVPA